MGASVTHKVRPKELRLILLRFFGKVRHTGRTGTHFVCRLVLLQAQYGKVRPSASLRPKRVPINAGVSRQPFCQPLAHIIGAYAAAT
jgi:hypothetical protein